MSRVTSLLLCHLALAVGLLPVSRNAWGQEAPAKDGTLTRMADIRALTREEAARQIPVRVRGVVQWVNEGKGRDFTLGDDSASIYALQPRDLKAGPEAGSTSPTRILQVGEEIELEGITNAGGYAPVVHTQRISVLGKGRALPLREVTIAHLGGGAEDSQRIGLEPVVVQSVVDNSPGAMRSLRVCSSSGDYTLITVEKASWNDPARLIDAEVQVRGTVLTLFNSRLEQTGVRIVVPSESDFTILKPPPPDPFGVPRVEIGALRLFRPGGPTPHRRVVEGTVTWISALEMVIENEGCGVSIHATPAQGISVGDRVIVSGFIEARQPIAFLSNAVVKKLAAGIPPTPAAPSVEEILDVSRANTGRFWGTHPKDFDHRLIRLKGTLIGKLSPGPAAFILQTETGKQVTARFAAGSIGFWETPLEGSLVEVTGVAIVLHGPGTPLPEFRKPTGLELMLRSAEDVHLLKVPSWWSAERLRLALLMGMALLGLVLAWVMFLRRTVRRQAQRIENALRAHRDAELEHEAAKRERLRLAGDLHDGVHQLLSAATYRLESVARLSELNPGAVMPHVDAAKKILHRSQHEMRSLMWGIHELAKEEPDFSELLTHALAGMDHWPADVVQVISHGAPQPVPARAAGSLLLLTQEAVQNSLKHGHASKIQVIVEFSREALSLTVQDNGSGFDPAMVHPTAQGGLGLVSIKRRVDELGGSHFLTSTPGEGTRLLIQLAWTRLRPLFPPNRLLSSVP